MVKSMLNELKSFNVIIVNTDTIHEVIANMISNIGNEKVILNYVGGKKLLFEDLINKSCQTILFSPNKESKDLSYSAQIIFGGLSCNNF